MHRLVDSKHLIFACVVQKTSPQHINNYENMDGLVFLVPVHFLTYVHVVGTVKAPASEDRSPRGGVAAFHPEGRWLIVQSYCSGSETFSNWFDSLILSIFSEER
jgi:hypothetical protein